MFPVEQQGNSRTSGLVQRQRDLLETSRTRSGFYLVGAELRKAMFSPAERSGASGEREERQSSDRFFFFFKRSLLGSRSYLRMLRTEREPRGRGDVQAFSEDT